MYGSRGLTSGGNRPLSCGGHCKQRRQRAAARGSSGRHVKCGAVSNKKLQIVFVSTEVAPWSKTGGLGDVVASLPAALAARGHKVMTVSPRYAAYPGVFDTGLLAPVEANDGHSSVPGPAAAAQLRAAATATQVSYARYYACNDRGVLRVFVDHPIFAVRAGDWPATGAAPVQQTLLPNAPPADLSAAPTPQTAHRQPPAASGSPEPPPERAAGPGSSGVAATPGTAPGAAPVPDAAGSRATAVSANTAASPPPSLLHGGWRSAAASASCSPWHDPVLAELQADGEAAAAAARGYDPSLGVYTYCEAEALAQQVDLQARNNVLCQAALAAPVLLWHDPGSMPPELRVDLSRGASGPSGFSVPPEALPFVIHNGIAEPASTLKPGAAERLRSALGLNRRVHLRSQSGGTSLSPSHRAVPWTGRASVGASDSRLAGAAAGRAGAKGEGSDVWAPPHRRREQQRQEVLFVGNDWPSALLPLWLQTYREVLCSASQWKAALQARLKQLDVAYGPMLATSPMATTSPSVSRQGAAAVAAAAPHEHAQGEAIAGGAGRDAPTALVGADDDVIAAELTARIAEGSAGGTAAVAAVTAEARCQWEVVAAAEAAEREQTRGSADRSAAPGPWPRERVAVADGDGGKSLQPNTEPSCAVASATVVLEPLEVPSPSSRNGDYNEVARRRHDGNLGVGGWPVKGSPYGSTNGSNSISSYVHSVNPVLDSGAPGGCESGSPPSLAEQAAVTAPVAAAVAPGTARARAPDAVPTDAVGLVCEERSRQEALLLQLVYTLNALALPAGLGAGGGPAAPVSVPAAVSGLETDAGVAADVADAQAADGTAEQEEELAQSASIAQSASMAQADGDEPQARMRGTLAAFRSFVGSRLQGSRVVLTVHNFAFQGVFSAETFWRLGLPLFALQQMLLGPAAPGKEASAPPPGATAGRGDGEDDHDPDSAARPPSATASGPAVRFMSWLKGALLSSDALVTVSPGYARELAGKNTAAVPAAAGTAGPGALPGLPAAGASELLEIVSSRGIRAIMNGLDDGTVWDPASDPMLPAELRFSAAGAAEGKARAKARLQAVLGLEIDPDVPLFGFVGRLDAQKGVDVVLAALPQLLGPPVNGSGYNRSLGCDRASADAAAEQARRGAASRRRMAVGLQALLRRLRIGRMPWQRPALVAAGGAAGAESVCGQAREQSDPQQLQQQRRRRLQVVMLGAGKQWLQDGLAALPRAYPGRAAGLVGFDEPLCHLLMAGADFLLVPSRWEPCGLVALAAQRYGAVPVVAPTGGLVDALLAPTPDGHRDELTGILMDEVVGREEDSLAQRRAVDSLGRAVGAACELYSKNRASYEVLRGRCMARDVSWEGPARQWEELLMELAEGDVGGSAAGDGAAGEQ